MSCCAGCRARVKYFWPQPQLWNEKAQRQQVEKESKRVMATHSRAIFGYGWLCIGHFNETEKLTALHEA